MCEKTTLQKTTNDPPKYPLAHIVNWIFRICSHSRGSGLENTRRSEFDILTIIFNHNNQPILHNLPL